MEPELLKSPCMPRSTHFPHPPPGHTSRQGCPEVLVSHEGFLLW